MGGLIVFASICVPYLVLSDRDAQSMAVFGVAIGLRRARLRRRLHQDRQTPLARPLGPLEAARPAVPRARPLVGRPPRGRPRADPLLPDRRRQHRPRPGPLLRPRLPRHRRHLERRQPHRRPRRPRRRLLRDRPPRLHGDRLRHQRAAEPGAALRLPGRRLRRLPLVQRLPGLDLHGGHRLARARRRDRRPRGDDPDRGAADHHRRHLRDRGALGRRSRSSPSRPSAAASC